MFGTIMVVGIGDTGFCMLQSLARTPRVASIVATTRHETEGIQKVNQVMYGASFEGYYPDMSYRKLDVLDVEGTAEILKEVRPSVICTPIRLGPWHPATRAKLQGAERLKQATFLPYFVLGVSKFMQSVKKSGIDALVQNAAYPDVVNQVLGKVGLAPTCGGGNLALLVPIIQQILSKKLNVPRREITVYIIANHGAFFNFFTGRMIVPLWTKVIVGLKDVSDRFTTEWLVKELASQRAQGGPGMPNPRTPHHIASSFVKNLLAMYFDTGEIQMTTGPNGLPGGYVVRLSRAGAEVVLPDGLTLEDAIKINEGGLPGDGIEQIKDDGTVVFTEEAVKAMREVLGYECEELKFNEIEERVQELERIAKKLL